MTKSSQKRVAAFVDEFVRSEFVMDFSSERASQGYGSRMDRYARCMDAAEHGADGSTHAEHIDDWRDAFELWIDERLRKPHAMKNGERRFGWEGAEWPQFQTAVLQHFNEVEARFKRDGTLHNQVG